MGQKISFYHLKLLVLAIQHHSFVQGQIPKYFNIAEYIYMLFLVVPKNRLSYPSLSVKGHMIIRLLEIRKRTASSPKVRHRTPVRLAYKVPYP